MCWAPGLGQTGDLWARCWRPFFILEVSDVGNSWHKQASFHSAKSWLHASQDGRRLTGYFSRCVSLLLLVVVGANHVATLEPMVVDDHHTKTGALHVVLAMRGWSSRQAVPEAAGQTLLGLTIWFATR